MGMGELDLSMFASKGAAATTNNFASRRGPVIISQKAASGVAMRAEASNGQNNYNSALGPPPQMSRYGSPSPPPSNLITSPLRIPGNFAGTPPPQQQMQMQNANALPPNPAVLGNQSDPGFLMHLHEVSRSLNEAFIEPFFAPTIQYIITITNEKTACEVLTAYAEGVRACPRFAEVLYQRNIFTRLPVGSDAQIDASLDLLGSLFSSAPYVITDALAQWIKFFFVKKPEELVTMYSHYVKKVTDYKQHLGVLDVLIQGGGLFAQLECADKYINVLTYLCKNQEYWSMRIEKIKPIVLYFINSSNPKIAAAAYSSLASIYDGNLTLDYNAVAGHAQNVEVAKAIISLLIRMRNELGASQELACLLLQLSRISEEALTLLLYKIQTSAELAAFVAADSSWYSVPLPTILGTLKIVLVLIIVPQSRSIILNSPDFNTILNFFASVPDNYSMGSLSILLQKLSLSQQTVAALSQCGFFKNIARNIAYITDANSIASLCILISTVAKVSQCVDFPLLIKPLMTVGKNLPEASGAVAQTLAGLSIHPNVNSAMKQMKLKSMFTLLFQVSGFQNIVGPALKNF